MSKPILRILIAILGGIATFTTAMSEMDSNSDSEI